MLTTDKYRRIQALTARKAFFPEDRGFFVFWGGVIWEWNYFCVGCKLWGYYGAEWVKKWRPYCNMFYLLYKNGGGGGS
jgi:hypothetical protein